MELKDFVSETLAQIVAGVADARAKVNTQDVVARINPFLDPLADLLAKHDFVLAGGDAVQFVKFEVTVTTKDATGTKGGIGVFVAPITLGSSGQSSYENSGFSRISFRVPLTLPRETEN